MRDSVRFNSVQKMKIRNHIMLIWSSKNKFWKQKRTTVNLQVKHFLISRKNWFYSKRLKDNSESRWMIDKNQGSKSKGSRNSNVISMRHKYFNVRVINKMGQKVWFQEFIWNKIVKLREREMRRGIEQENENSIGWRTNSVERKENEKFKRYSNELASS